MDPLEKLLEIKKSRKKFLEVILHRTDPAAKRKFAKLRPFVDYEGAERKRMVKQHQKLEKEIEELELQISKNKLKLKYYGRN